jgi:pyrroline-5-carboxylate reductase
MRRIGIIGSGNLGQNLSKMLTRRNNVPVNISCRNKELYPHLYNKLGRVTIYDDNTLLVKHSDVILLSVKPGNIKNVCEEINPYLDTDKYVISTAAAVPLKSLYKWLPSTIKIIRCMPNIPCSIDKGVVTYYSNFRGDNKIMEDIFGKNLIIPLKNDKQVDITTLVSGCGPAFFVWYSDCLKMIGKDVIPDFLLNDMIRQTMIGTGEMMNIHSNSEIIRQVASPKGATECTLNEFNLNDLDFEIYKALFKAQTKIDTMSSTY